MGGEEQGQQTPVFLVFSDDHERPHQELCKSTFLVLLVPFFTFEGLKARKAEKWIQAGPFSKVFR